MGVLAHLATRREMPQLCRLQTPCGRFDLWWRPLPVAVVPLSCTVIREGNSYYLIDAGGGDNWSQSYASRLTAAVQRTIPKGGRLAAILLTHGHPDHVGALPQLLRVRRHTRCWRLGGWDALCEDAGCAVRLPRLLLCWLWCRSTPAVHMCQLAASQPASPPGLPRSPRHLPQPRGPLPAGRQGVSAPRLNCAARAAGAGYRTCPARQGTLGSGAVVQQPDGRYEVIWCMENKAYETCG